MRMVLDTALHALVSMTCSGVLVVLIVCLDPGRAAVGGAEAFVLATSYLWCVALMALLVARGGGRGNGVGIGPYFVLPGVVDGA